MCRPPHHRTPVRNREPADLPNNVRPVCAPRPRDQTPRVGRCKHDERVARQPRHHVCPVRQRSMVTCLPVWAVGGLNRSLSDPEHRASYTPDPPPETLPSHASQVPAQPTTPAAPRLSAKQPNPHHVGVSPPRRPSARLGPQITANVAGAFPAPPPHPSDLRFSAGAARVSPAQSLRRLCGRLVGFFGPVVGFCSGPLRFFS